MQSFVVFFVVDFNKLLNKHSSYRNLSMMPMCRHCKVPWLKRNLSSKMMILNLLISTESQMTSISQTFATGYSGKCQNGNFPLQWRHNGHDGVSNNQPHHCLFNRLFSADQRKHQSSASLAFVRGIHRSPVNSPHKWPVTRKMFPCDDVIMDVATSRSASGNFIKNNISVSVFDFNMYLSIITERRVYCPIRCSFSNEHEISLRWLIITYVLLSDDFSVCITILIELVTDHFNIMTFFISKQWIHFTQFIRTYEVKTPPWGILQVDQILKEGISNQFLYNLISHPCANFKTPLKLWNERVSTNHILMCS